jgi:tocopherol cyclase
MECYHGVLSFDHSIKGYIDINREIKDFNGGKGCIEKDWGASMPSSWIWIQTNHFDEDKTSLFGSIDKIPWLSYFTGYIFGFLYKEHLYKFTTYSGAKISKLNVSKNKIEVSIGDKHHYLEIDAKRE